MSFIDDLCDTKMYDEKESRIKYSPLKLGFAKKKKVDRIKNEVEGKRKHNASIARNIGDTLYTNMNKWYVCLKGSHLHKRCLEELLGNSLDKAKGLLFCEYVDTLCPSFLDYWYDQKNHKHYTKQQLKRVEREFNENSRDSESLVMEMLESVWFSIVPEDMMYMEIDNHSIYSLRVKYMK